MTSSPHSDTGAREGAESSAQKSARRVAYLDQTLWAKLEDASTLEEFCLFWLALQCRMIAGVERGVAVLGPADAGPFAPAAAWPEMETDTRALTPALERALKERQGVVQGHGRGAAGEQRATCYVAFPFVFEGALNGAVGLEVRDRSDDELRAVMQQLQWGAGRIELWRARRAVAFDEAREANLDAMLDLIAEAIEGQGFRATCLAVATLMATRLKCERVAIGLRHHGRTRVEALSHTTRLRGKMNLVRSIRAAMDEAIDQKSAVAHPGEADDRAAVTAAHAALAREHAIGAVLTAPFTVKDEILGAVTFERGVGESFDQSEIDLMECLASAIGPIITLKQRDDRHLVFKIASSIHRLLARLLGPRHYVHKLVAAGVLAVTAFFAVATAEYRVSAPAEIEGLVQRVVVAPFDGYVLSESARAGDVVAEGDVLAALDDHDFALERLRWVSTQAQVRAQHDQALAERRAADVNVYRAQMEQAEAEIALLDEQVARATLRAPFDGLVIAGDLSQTVGASVGRGATLFEIAPLDAYRVILTVDENDITAVRVGQEGRALMSSLPGEPLDFVVEQITPVSQVGDGRNTFRVEARLLEASERLRPGMSGAAKVDVERRKLLWIWTHELTDWFRIKFWGWWP